MQLLSIIFFPGDARFNQTIPDTELSAPPFLSALSLASSAMILSRLSVLPLDNLRILLQINPSETPTFRHFVIRSYRGMVPRVLGSAVYSGTHFACFNVSGCVRESESHAGILAAHSFAKLMATTFSYPFDVRYTLRVSGVKSIPGLNGYFAGFALGLAGVPFSVLGSLSTLSFLSLIFPLGDVNTDHDFARGVAVGLAGAIGGGVVSYPIDTIRRRVITRNFTVKEAIKAGRFFRGLPVLLIKAIPESALLTYSYMCNLRYFSFTASS